MIQKEEGYLWPHNETAAQMLNKVRAFTGWPGNTLPIALSGSSAPLQGTRVLVSDAEVLPAAELPAGPADEERPGNRLVWVPARDGREAAIAVRPACDPDHALLVRSLQIPGKKQVRGGRAGPGQSRRQRGRDGGDHGTRWFSGHRSGLQRPFGTIRPPPPERLRRGAIAEKHPTASKPPGADDRLHPNIVILYHMCVAPTGAARAETSYGICSVAGNIWPYRRGNDVL
ncbi:unnamed protein product [Prorocentrum cordatum]|uniref:Formyl transferase C-terminal domain-containing protein n=1 Tax=Prorocentrum cordatum TaxID=2364126 RepID=A0ABN9QK89_9DINO|nr:unnamed protein product [Polarella glacialis]